MRRQDYRHFAEPLAVHAEGAADFLAFIYLDDDWNEHKITFGELHERALGFAHDLLTSARPGDRALLLLPPGLDYVAAIFGCFYAGVIGVSAPPPDPRRLERTLGRLFRIADSAGTKIVVTTTPFVEVAKSTIPEGHSLRSARWIAADASPSSSDASIIADPRPSDIAFLQYTSGSTSDPRGVKLTHANLLDNSRFIAREFAHDVENSLGFNWIPPFHDMGLIGAILQPVYFGGLHLEEAVPVRDPERPPSVLAAPLAVVKRPIRWLEGVSDYRATTSGGPNFAYDMCVERIKETDCEGLDLSSWEVSFNGAEPIRSATMTAFAEKFGRYGFRSSSFFPVYGLAEATLMVTAPSKDRAPEVQRFDSDALLDGRAIASEGENAPALVGCGSPDELHRVEIVDPTSGARLEEGEIGEIWVSGPSVAAGYWGGEADPESPFLAALPASEKPFLRTGDLGTFYKGELYVTGRQSDLIILNGRNHHPHDIEALAEAAGTLLTPHGSAAFELLATDGTPRIALIAESTSTDVEALNEELLLVRTKVADEMEIPLSLAAVGVKNAVPKTTSGKIQRRLCRSLFLDGEIETLAEWRSPDLAKVLDPA